jgi:hypothetical protein
MEFKICSFGGLKYLSHQRTSKCTLETYRMHFDELLEHQALMVHHISVGFSRSTNWPTFGYNQSGDRPELYISRSSSRHACRSENQPVIEDIRVVDLPSRQSAMIWMHRWPSWSSLSNWLDVERSTHPKCFWNSVTFGYHLFSFIVWIQFNMEGWLFCVFMDLIDQIRFVWNFLNEKLCLKELGILT